MQGILAGGPPMPDSTTIVTPSRLPPAIGVGALVFDAEGQVLLVRRAHPPHAGQWHLPGGRLEYGETVEDCCRREVREETGLLVLPERIIAIADRRIEGFHYVIIDFLAYLQPGTPALPQAASDATEARWASPEALAAWPLVDGLDAVIRAGRHSRDNGSGLVADAATGWLYGCARSGR